MSDESLTYRTSGVDVEANLEVNRRIQAFTRRTYSGRVLTRTGTFGGALSLTGLPKPLERLELTGRVISAQGSSPEQNSLQIARACRSRLSGESRPIAFLDYLAAAHLDAARAADLVGLFSGVLAEKPKIPIIGGETAEMPDVFLEGAWEVVGALFAAETVEAAERAETAEAVETAKAKRRIGLGSLRNVEQPVLVFSMDGVGTKTKIGTAVRRTSGLAADIIHHSLDDILCQGARGIGFMLYLGCQSRDERLIEPFLSAAQACCDRNGITLLDSKVSEKPDLYRPGEIDVCGAIVGVVEADRLIQGDGIRPGDILLGLASSGLHTNGYSLARKALLERGGFTLDQHIEEIGGTLGRALLEPHKNYAPLILPLLADAELGGGIKGIAHVTGGGLKDNLERILPRTVRVEIRKDSWRPPPIFDLIRRAGNIPLQDPVGKGMYESFNMGIGLVLVVSADFADRILGRIRAAGEQATVIGQVLQRRAGTPAAGSSRANARAEGANRRSAVSEQRVRLL